MATNPTPYGLPPTPAPEPVKQSLWQKHGTTAQWAAVGVALLASLAGNGILLHNRSVDTDTKKRDEHTNVLIDAKLGPSVSKVNEHTDTKTAELGTKLDHLSDRIGGLSDRVSTIEGALGKRISGLDGRVSGVETRASRQVSLAKFLDPNRVLTLIREEIALAQEQNRPLPAAQLTDYKNTVQELPSSAHAYWATVAAVVNYQSHLLQVSGEAPDPTKVSRTCGGITAGTGGHNIFKGMTLIGCVVDLDGVNDSFDGVVFRNSVIRYAGGTTHLHNVRFENCNFQLTIPPQKTPEKPSFLFSLLDSPSQTSVKVE